MRALGRAAKVLRAFAGSFIKAMDRFSYFACFACSILCNAYDKLIGIHYPLTQAWKSLEPLRIDNWRTEQYIEPEDETKESNAKEATESSNTLESKNEAEAPEAMPKAHITANELETVNTAPKTQGPMGTSDAPEVKTTKGPTSDSLNQISD